jgi:HrpA-like RNA helicase
LGNEFAIITGDTGSGKSTQLPQFVMDSDKLQDFFKEKRKDKNHEINIVVT